MAWEERWVGTSLMYALTDGNGNYTDAKPCVPHLMAAMHSHWVYEHLGECVMNVRQWFAFIIGMLSIAFWLVAQVP